jgi:hypothetical protein
MLKIAETLDLVRYDLLIEGAVNAYPSRNM